MKNQLTIDSTLLKEVLKQAVSALPNNSVMEQLQNIELTADKGTLSVRSTDMELDFCAKLKIKKDCAGQMLTDGKRISAIVELLSGDVTITFTPKGLIVESEGSKYNLSSQIGTLPNFTKEFKPKCQFDIRSGALNEMISTTLFAVQPQKMQTALSGLSLILDKKTLRFYGSDSHIFSRSSVKMKSGGGQAILPQKICLLVQRAFEDEDITVSFNESLIRFTGKNTELSSRLIEITMPEFEKVIQGFKPITTVSVSNEKLTQAIKRAMVMTEGDLSYVVFTLAKNTLSITCDDKDKGSDGLETIPVDYKGGEVTVKLNAKNIYNIVTHIECPNLSLQFTEKPILILPETQGDVELFSLTMQIN